MTSSISSAASLKMLNMVTGLWVTQAIYIAAELRLADLLNEKPQSSNDLANVTQTDASALYRVLRALAGLEIFSEDADGCFHLTPLAEYLRSDVPGHSVDWVLRLPTSRLRLAARTLIASESVSSPGIGRFLESVLQPRDSW